MQKMTKKEILSEVLFVLCLSYLVYWFIADPPEKKFAYANIAGVEFMGCDAEGWIINKNNFDVYLYIIHYDRLVARHHNVEVVLKINDRLTYNLRSSDWVNVYKMTGVDTREKIGIYKCNHNGRRE